MRKLRRIIIKETLLLVRDIPGLIILFLMPLILITTITATQENAFKRVSETKVNVLFVDRDTSLLGETIRDGLKQSDFFVVKDELDGKPITREIAQGLIASGVYQVGIIIPENTSDSAQQRAKNIVKHSFYPDSIAQKIPDTTQNTQSITLLYDPALRESYKNSLNSSLNRLIQAAETRILTENFMSALPEYLGEKLKAPVHAYLRGQLDTMENVFSSELKKRMGDMLPKDFHIDAKPKAIKFDIGQSLKKNFKLKQDWQNHKFIPVNEEYAGKQDAVIKPTIVQNNVPAFALFAMFFIVIPLAGSMITERKEGAYGRLRTLPVKYFSVLSGKIIVYVIVCLLQLVLMILTGMYLLPVLYGLPALEIGHNIGALLIAALCSALAAVGFGLLVGTFTSSMSQAGMFGSFMVVILGILGGIFLPVYMMPDQLKIVTVLSPIRWGVDSFLDIFVRGGTIGSILPNAMRLFLFFGLSLLIALINFVKRK
ncbi:MAG: ABC transporter permease [Bacteroidota bacterium]